MTKRTWGLAAMSAVVAVAIGAGVVMAQSDEDGTGVSFLDRVAQKLGVQRETLDQAIEDARSDEIDERVASGDLTQEQADRLKERLGELPADAPFPGPGFGHKFPGGEFGFGAGEGFGFAFKFGFGGHGVGFDNESMAEFLGIDAATLGEELRADGATLASVAEAHGKSRDELIAFIVGDLETKVSEAVAEGDLTQERADEIITEATEHVGEMVDQAFGARPFKGEFGFPGPRFGLGFVSEDLAEFLGIDEAQLREELQADGATVASVAEAHGKSRDELKAHLMEGITEKLNAMVADGMLTQERADEILSNYNERLDGFIDGDLPGFGGHFRGEFKGGLPFGDEMFEYEFDGDMFEDDLEPSEGAPSDGTQGSELIPAFRS